MSETKPEMRTFKGGATRNTSKGKLDYEGFLSPLVLKRYCEYLNSHRKQADGKMRDSDNWQKGIPVDVYMKSLLRHAFDVWMIHRGIRVVEDGKVVTIQDALCASLFNHMGYLHEILDKPPSEPVSDDYGPCNLVKALSKPYSITSIHQKEQVPGPPCDILGPQGKCVDCDDNCVSHPDHEKIEQPPGSPCGFAPQTCPDCNESCACHPDHKKEEEF